MKDQHIEEFEAWWTRAKFRDLLRWSRKEGPLDGDRKQALPSSPKKMARAAWNAAWHVLTKTVAAKIAEVEVEADRRVRAANSRLAQAAREIDVLERRTPMPESEFEARMLVARNFALKDYIRELTGREISNAEGSAYTSALRAAIGVADAAVEVTNAFKRGLDEERSKRQRCDLELESAHHRIMDLVEIVKGRHSARPVRDVLDEAEAWLKSSTTYQGGPP
jgi:hypothetical protein